MLSLSSRSGQSRVMAPWRRMRAQAIQAQVENPLASRILAGEFGQGDTVRVDAQGGQLVFARG